MRNACRSGVEDVSRCRAPRPRPRLGKRPVRDAEKPGRLRGSTLAIAAASRRGLLILHDAAGERDDALVTTNRWEMRSAIRSARPGGYLLDRLRRPDAGAGTLPPSRLASERPIAMACLRLVTFWPDRPLRSVPAFSSFMARSTLADAFFPYLGMGPPWLRVRVGLSGRSVADLKAKCAGRLQPSSTAASAVPMVGADARHPATRKTSSGLPVLQNHPCHS
jgi:hypothetical protein